MVAPVTITALYDAWANADAAFSAALVAQYGPDAGDARYGDPIRWGWTLPVRDAWAANRAAREAFDAAGGFPEFFRNGRR